MPRTATCHSTFDGSRLRAFSHAACAWNEVMFADGARRADRPALVPLSFHKDGSPFEHALLDYSSGKRSPPRSR